MRCAIVYYSLEGNSALVAERLEALLDADVIQLVCQKPYPSDGPRKFVKGGKDAAFGVAAKLEPYSFNVASYDLVILAMPVWASRVPPAMNTFLRDNDLSGVRVALALSSTGGDATKCAADCQKKLKTQAQMPILSVTDPKAGKEPELDAKIARFCEELKA